MSRPSSETGAALAFLEHMFDSSSQSHLVAIDVAGKVIARSFSVGSGPRAISIKMTNARRTALRKK
jgi:hypothetical protein